MKTRRINPQIAITLSAIASGLALAACSPSEDGQTAGQKLDQTVASVGQKSAQMTSDARKAGNEMARAASDGVDHAADKVKDATITAAINAKLAMDGKLSAMNIDVDTADGQVVLRGSAPDERARESATQLAMSVEGVRGVDNQLVLAGKSADKS